MLVGVIPNAPDFTHPADRRRFVPYFHKEGILYETAEFSKSYDAVYISISADLGLWSQYKAVQRAAGKLPRVVFDLSDDLLSEKPARDMMRGVFYYLTRRNSAFDLSYKKAVVRMVESADIVLCGSDEQKAGLDRLHDNVVVMRDFFLDDLGARKPSLSLRRPGELNVLWEGLSHGNVEIFRMLREVLDGVDGFRVNAHVVTDPTYCRVGSSHFCEPTWALLSRIFDGSRVRVHHYAWTPQTFSAIASSCDIGVIPVPRNPVMRRKPENKLLLLWQVGLPVVTSDTASYSRVMHEVGQDFAATSLADWKRMVESLGGDQAVRERYMAAANRYLEDACSETAIMKVWRQVLPKT
jgi:hypothetical protein